MKLSFTSLLFVIVFFGFSQKKTQLISWNDGVQLEWQHFKAKPNRVSSFKALTAISVSFGIRYENSSASVEIVNEFDPKKSWTKVKDNEYLLNHERLHFDIAELFARKLRKKILETTFKSKGKKLINEITSLYQESMRDLEKSQRAYDRETEHSIVKQAQKKWEAAIKTELVELSQYSATTIQLQIK